MRFSRKRFILCLIVIWTSIWTNGCATSSLLSCPLPDDPPIYVSRSEKLCLTKETKQEIVTHNETWEKNIKGR